MIAILRQRAEALNRRLDALDVEGKKLRKDASIIDKKLENFKDAQGKSFVRRTDIKRDAPIEYFERVQKLRREMKGFQKEAAAELSIKRQQAAEVAKSKQVALARSNANAKAVAPTSPIAVPQSNGPAPAVAPPSAPLPSSVPGLPAGVEPVRKKKAEVALPPGMTKGK